MRNTSKRYVRSTETIPPKQRVVVITEGRSTEPAYLSQLGKLLEGYIFTVVAQNGQSAPAHLVKKITAELKESPLSKNDRAWIIYDADAWSQEHHLVVERWKNADARHSLGISNPAFEYWLLLHFENGTGRSTATEIQNALTKHLPHHSKTNLGFTLTAALLDTALAHAITRAKHHPYPAAGSTTVHALILQLTALQQES